MTTVQDLGRIEFRRFGINPNGAMDKTAVRLINILLGNEESEAVLEMHFPAPEVIFQDECFFSVGGAEFEPVLNEKQINNWQMHFAVTGSVLRFNRKLSGNRAYLSLRGGFDIEQWLGSTSTNLLAKIGGFYGRKLQAGDVVNYNKKTSDSGAKSNYKISNTLIPCYDRFPTVRVLAGAEFELLTALGELLFLKNDFIVTRNSDRMGFRLQSEPLYLIDEMEKLSSAVNFGAIQLLPNGQLIILMADHQTTGGYPRIAQIIERDLPLVAQLGEGDKIAFEIISLHEAENILLKFEKELAFLRTGSKFIR